MLMEPRKTPPIFILGGHQTDYGRNLTREGKTLADLIRETTQGALAAAEVDASAIEVGHIGNFAGELFVGQGHLGGLLVEADPAFAGLPTTRHEAACASGSVAALAAMADLEAGRYDVAIVLGAELMRNGTAVQASQKLGAAAWVPRETDGLTHVWPELFSRVGDAYAERFGLDRSHLVAIAQSNFENARRNPNAQTRSWQLGPHSFAEDAPNNPRVAGRLHKYDCSQVTDGGAAIVLASERFARAHAARTGRPLSQIIGFGHRTARMALTDKLEASRGGAYVFPEVRRAITDAFARAGVPDVTAIDAIETHDCFTTTQYMAIDHFGITAPGESWKAIEAGTTLFGGRLPMNPSGGLMGLGHPVGASGVRMLLDAHKQITGTAGAYQVEGAKQVATLNIGGSATTSVCFVVARS
ncbi:3-ketoacyl-CoA thiolase [Minicystis rosea]|nr:3-ketoacyl-CoA thiolase [Minicystis rosea]